MKEGFEKVVAKVKEFLSSLPLAEVEDDDREELLQHLEQTVRDGIRRKVKRNEKS
jgi:hypothetical protein